MDHMLTYHYPGRIYSGSISEKLNSQRSIISIIFHRQELIFQVFLILSIIFFFIHVMISFYLLIITLIVVLLNAPVRWFHLINNCNYNWFKFGHGVDLSENIFNDNFDIKSLNQFLETLNLNNWYIQNYQITKSTKKIIKFILVFNQREDAIQCKLVI